ncbi:MAG: hypothetical protein WBQ73_02775 [Candidatus Babeliales bacterium]
MKQEKCIEAFDIEARNGDGRITMLRIAKTSSQWHPASIYYCDYFDGDYSERSLKQVSEEDIRLIVQSEDVDRARDYEIPFCGEDIAGMNYDSKRREFTLTLDLVSILK